MNSYGIVRNRTKCRLKEGARQTGPSREIALQDEGDERFQLIDRAARLFFLPWNKFFPRSILEGDAIAGNGLGGIADSGDDGVSRSRPSCR